MGLPPVATDGVLWAHLDTQAATSTQFRLNVEMNQCQTLTCWTPLLPHVGFIFISEMLQGAQHRIGSRLPQSAEGWLMFRARVSSFSISPSSPFLGKPGKNLQHSRGPDAARRTFAAGFVLGEVQEETGNIHHTGVLIHDD